MTEQEFRRKVGAVRYGDMVTDPELEFRLSPIECHIIWEHGEVTYLKGHNALRLAMHWLKKDRDCLAVMCNHNLYLKEGQLYDYYNI